MLQKSSKRAHLTIVYSWLEGIASYKSPKSALVRMASGFSEIPLHPAQSQKNSKFLLDLLLDEIKSHLCVDFISFLCYSIVWRWYLMLIQFSFKNYKSFRDEATLDLSANKITEFSDSVMSVGGEHVLPVAAIYGANASGKSNLYKAFEYMRRYVVNSFNYGGEDEYFDNVRPTPFLFEDDTENAETSFEVYFTIPGDETEKTYNYGFCIGNEGVTEEWLNVKAKTTRRFSRIFYREETTNTLELQRIDKVGRSNIMAALNKQSLIVSLGAKLKIEVLKRVREWFSNIVFADFTDTYKTILMQSRLPKGFTDDPSVRNNVVKYFSTFDNSIKDLRVEELTSEDLETKNTRFKVSTCHKKVGSDEFAEIPLGDESAGTLKMFALYPDLQNVLQKGSVLVIDELNAKLHPLLVRNFILTFLNPEINVNHAQLVFTIQDTWQLSNHLLRRDEVWFTEKDEQGVSTLYSLADFADEDGTKIRKDENYEKNYLLGKYGAIPSLARIQSAEG